MEGETAPGGRSRFGASLAVLIGLTVGVAPTMAARESVERTFDPSTRVFSSAAEPEMRLPIPEGFQSLGRLQFTLGETAWVDLHVFAEVEERRITRLVVLQFERFVDGAEGRYRFVVPPEEQRAGSNYRFSARPVEIGGHQWVHNTWAFDQAASAAAQPGRESDRTLALVAERGLEIDDELVMSRFVRAVGDDARAELILFSMEPLRDLGHRLEDFPDGGPPSEAYDRISAAVTERSLALFSRLESASR